MTTVDPTGPTARRFPLVPRPRPICLPLEQRVAQLCHRAEAAERNHDPAEAAAVHNLAALLASDCGLPDLARQWCHRQADVYLRACPLGPQAARHALEPLVNLARLHIRADDGECAYRLIHTLFEAVSTRTNTVIDGLAVPAADLTTSPQAHSEVRRWLWSTLLATGARALAVTGRWDDARNSLLQYKGIGLRMLDGRQVDVLAHATAGDLDGARALCDTTAPGEPWEAVVTACLSRLCGAPTPTSTLVEQYRSLLEGQPRSTNGDHTLSVFLTRLGLTLLDLTRSGGATPTVVVSQVTRCRDGYAARDLLEHDGGTAALSNAQHAALSDLVQACALGVPEKAQPLLPCLEAALITSEAVIARSVRPARRNIEPQKL